MKTDIGGKLVFKIKIGIGFSKLIVFTIKISEPTFFALLLKKTHKFNVKLLFSKKIAPPEYETIFSVNSALEIYIKEFS